MTVPRSPYKSLKAPVPPFKPLLAATLESIEALHSLDELMVSPKLDGFRCIIYNGQAVSRNLKPIPNLYIQKQLHGLPNGLDGELIVGEPNIGQVFNRTSSGVTSVEGEPDFTFWIFDHAFINDTFEWRLEGVRQTLRDHVYKPVRMVPHAKVHSLPSIQAHEEHFVSDGYEGIMIRRASGRYKQGRSTHNEGILWKLKRFVDGELLVTSIVEGQSNQNPATRDATGAIERGTKAEFMVPNGQVGTIIGKDLATGQIMEISPGKMTHDKRQYYFQHPQELAGKIVKYKAFAYGAVDAPRFATFQGFRDPIDM